MSKLIMNIKKLILGMLVATSLLSAGAVPVMAVAPKKECYHYLEKGKFEIEFVGRVKYNSPKIVVKNEDGKTYKASLYSKGSESVKFKIDDYDDNMDYTYIISGIKKRGTKAYDSITGKVNLPSEKGVISSESAKSKALKDADLDKDSVSDLECKRYSEDGDNFYEVTFKTKKYEYEYEISIYGKVLYKERESL